MTRAKRSRRRYRGLQLIKSPRGGTGGCGESGRPGLIRASCRLGAGHFSPQRQHTRSRIPDTLARSSTIRLSIGGIIRPNKSACDQRLDSNDPTRKLSCTMPFPLCTSVEGGTPACCVALDLVKAPWSASLLHKLPPFPWFCDGGEGIRFGVGAHHPIGPVQNAPTASCKPPEMRAAYPRHARFPWLSGLRPPRRRRPCMKA